MRIGGLNFRQLLQIFLNILLTVSVTEGRSLEYRAVVTGEASLITFNERPKVPIASNNNVGYWFWIPGTNSNICSTSTYKYATKDKKTTCPAQTL